MTEKRFTLAYEKGNWWAVKDYDITLWKEEVIGLLNELSEKNEQLKMGNNSLKLLVQNWEALDEEKDEQLDKQNQALKKLKKENEQLRQYKDAIFNWDSSKIIRVNMNTGKVDLVEKVMWND